MVTSLLKRTLCFSVLVLLIAVLGGMPIQAQQAEEPKTPAAGNKVIITGQLVREDGSPVTHGNVGVYETKDGSTYTMRVVEAGVLANPGCNVDDEGRFRIGLDLDVFKDAEKFMLMARLGSFASSMSPLRDSNGTVIVFKFSEGAKNLDLGKIVVE